MIETVVEKWHAHLRGELPGGLDELLDEDCVFYSPIVFSPQRGREITKLYLQAASVALPGDDGAGGEGGDGGSAGSAAEGDRPTAFRYTKSVMSGQNAVLEFETTVAGKYVNGVDIITCNDAGRITEFRVMVRPLQAVNAVHAQMGATLEKMAPKG